MKRPSITNDRSNERNIHVHIKTSIFIDIIKIALGIVLGVAIIWITAIGGIWLFATQYRNWLDAGKITETKNAINTQIQVNTQKEKAKKARQESEQKELAWKAWYKTSETCEQPNKWENFVKCTNEKIIKRREFEAAYATNLNQGK